jgi:DNA-binding NtrC family response regulator
MALMGGWPIFKCDAKLLIVDEDVSMRRSLSWLFAERGYRVRSAENAFSALLEVQHGVPDILISDLNMPGKSGIEFLSVVRDRLPSIRVIAMGGGFAGNRVPPGVAADAFYQKGKSPDLLIEFVHAMTQPKRSGSRPSMHDLFGFQVFETIPPHPSPERLASSARRTHYQLRVARQNEHLGFSQTQE